jgi:two-component system, LytTR family, response regulator
MKVLIVEDEVKGAKVLQKLLHVYCPQVEVLGMAHSVQEGATLITDLQPEVVFLDIEMPDGNGFDLLEKFKERNFQVIFTTAYQNFAIQAFKSHAVSYLLKPIDPDELQDAVARLQVVQKQDHTHRIANIEQSLRDLLAQHSAPQRLAVHSVDGITYIESDKIIRLEADSNYTHIFLVGGKKITSSKTLKEYETTLSSLRFFRVHHAHIVNLNFIEKYIKGEGGYVVTSDQVTIEVSRRRKAELLKVIG